MIKIFDLIHGYKKLNSANHFMEEPAKQNVREFRKNSLEHINLHVRKGSFVSIIGPNGSGKSTLARHLNALLQPDSGTILVDGMNSTDRENIFKIRQTCGMVFQNPDNQLIAGIVEEDVAFGPENLCFSSREIQERVKDALSKMHMEAYEKCSTYQLSGGQKQKVAIAGALAMTPSCIIFDEATAMLEPQSRNEFMNCIHELNQKYGVTIIMITHHMEEVVDSDYVYVMDKGTIVKEGTPKEIVSEPEFLRSLGLDVPVVPRIAGILKEKGLISKADILTGEELVECLKQNSFLR